MGTDIYENRRPKGGRGRCKPPRVTLESLDAKLNSLTQQLGCVHADVAKLLRREPPGGGVLTPQQKARMAAAAAELKSSTDALDASAKDSTPKE